MNPIIGKLSVALNVLLIAVIIYGIIECREKEGDPKDKGPVSVQGSAFPKSDQFLSKEAKAAITGVQGYSSEIKPFIAVKFIKNYQENVAADVTKSVWLGREVLDYITKNDAEAKFTGIRVYIAKYLQAGEIGVGDSRIDRLTVIACPTYQTGTDEADAAYFDYGNLCPDVCRGVILAPFIPAAKKQTP